MPGRNEPCTCGSGRKYKYCCLKAQEQADFLWRQLRAAEGRLVPELLEMALRECGHELVEAGLDEFFLWDGVPENYEATDGFSQFFLPWFVYEFVDDPDDPDRVANAPHESLASLYLRRHGERLSSIERAFLEAAATSPLSFYAVIGTVPGSEMALRDVLTGAEVIVRERSASGMVKWGALLFTRVITAQGTSIMSGCAPLVIPPEWHLPILDFRERFANANGHVLTPDLVREIDIELRELYFAVEDRLWNPPLPELRNTDGEELVLTTLTYRLRCSPSAAFDRLKALARASKDDVTQLLAAAELDDVGQVRAVTIPWSKRGNRLHQDWDNTTLGTLEINGERLHVHVNSNSRARRIEREIAKRLGPDAVLESRTADSIEKLLAERKTMPRDSIADREQEELQRQPEIQEFLRQQGERHWESWLETRLPALGNRTPRQAAGTTEGRERLEALFAEFAWMSQRGQNPMSPDLATLRGKLGLG